jgi:hypothetical protein
VLSTPFFLPLNPRGLIDFSGITKPDGTIVEKLYYNSTGLCKAVDQSTLIENKMSQYAPFGWTGLYLDDYTGKYHAHYRN